MNTFSFSCPANLIRFENSLQRFDEPGNHRRIGAFVILGESDIKANRQSTGILPNGGQYGFTHPLQVRNSQWTALGLYGKSFPAVLPFNQNKIAITLMTYSHDTTPVIVSLTGESVL